MIDWNVIENEYVNGNISYRELSKKYNVSFNTLQVRAKDYGWVKKRKEQQEKIKAKLRQKTAEKIANAEANRLARISTAADKLLEKIELATEQLDQFLVTNKAKEKVVQYEHNKAGFGKPKKEIVKEIEQQNIVKIDYIDKAGLKQLASALKDLKDIQIANDNPQSQTIIPIVISGEDKLE